MDSFITNYDEYEEQNDRCLRFPYKNHRLGRSDFLKRDRLPRFGSYGSESSQRSNTFVYCCDCRTYMHYKKSKEDHFRGWICPECKERVSVEMILDQLALEEKEVMEQMLLMDELKATINPIYLSKNPAVWDEAFERISSFFYN